MPSPALVAVLSSAFGRWRLVSVLWNGDSASKHAAPVWELHVHGVSESWKTQWVPSGCRDS